MLRRVLEIDCVHLAIRVMVGVCWICLPKGLSITLKLNGLHGQVPLSC